MRKVVLAVCCVFLWGCDSDTKETPDGGGGGTITLTGRLVVGEQEALPPAPLLDLPRPPPGDPLAGYQLYCVTFSTPPAAASGTADASGLVTLDLDAAGVAFGCFVLDTEGEGVAVLIFKDGLEQGQTVTLTSDADLGNISVDVANEVAQTELIDTGTLTGSEGFVCPLGTWEATVPRQDCTGTATTTFWIVQDTAGQYRMGYTLAPVQLPDSGGICGMVAMADILGTESGGAYTFVFPADPTCPDKTMNVTLTPNGGCTELTAEVLYGGCASCTGGCECGGTLTCPLATTTAIRK